MRTEVPFSDIIGKVIDGIEYSTYAIQMVLTFTDNTFATLGIDHVAECAPEFEEQMLKEREFDDKDLIRLGITSEEELKNKRQMEAERQRLETEAYERRKYEELKARFGRESPDE